MTLLAPSRGLPALQVLADASSRLGGGSIVRRDVEVLLLASLGIERSALYGGDIRMGSEALERFEASLDRRLNHEPIQYILGQVDFLDFRLEVGPGVLVPRPETEWWLEEFMVRWRSDRPDPSLVLDLGTGSGCMALALARAFPSATVVASDLAWPAVVRTSENVERLRLTNVIPVLSDGLTAFRSGVSFDMVVSNPPYIRAEDFGRLDPDVGRWEPFHALVAGPSGLEYYESWIPGLHGMIRTGGRLAMEVGSGQGSAVADMMTKAGFRNVSVRLDLAGHDRAVIGEA